MHLTDDRYADLLPAPKGDLQIDDLLMILVAFASVFLKLLELARLARPWLVWKCWPAITTCHFAVT